MQSDYKSELNFKFFSEYSLSVKKLWKFKYHFLAELINILPKINWSLFFFYPDMFRICTYKK